MIGKSILFTILIVIPFFGFLVFRGSLPIVQKTQAVLAPIPAYLINTKLVKGLDFWEPNDSNVLSAGIEKPRVSAVSAFVYDIATDTVLFEKESKKQLPIASLVKIVTAIVALESKDPQSLITVSQHAATIGENSMGISAGETYTLEELLYGLVLNSGNDAAVALAEGVGGTEEHFVELMNQKAKILGLSDTVFINSSGLEEDNKEEHSSAYDLAILTKHALTLPTFARVAQTVEYEIPYTSNHKYIPLYNQTNLLTSYPGVKGVKTGYTPAAGLCLVTYAENGGHKLIGVILNSPSRREEMRKLLDYSFAVLGVKVPGRNF